MEHPNITQCRLCFFSLVFDVLIVEEHTGKLVEEKNGVQGYELFDIDRSCQNFHPGDDGPVAVEPIINACYCPQCRIMFRP